MPVHDIVRAETGAVKVVPPAPFAALPHEIAADPRLTPVDKCVLLALLYWARDKATCWPSNRAIGGRCGRSASTVQRSLNRLAHLGTIAREWVEPGPDNPTGRVIALAWRPQGTAIPPEELRALPYAEYLRTPHWRETRDRALKRAGNACAICPATDELDVHHRTYERLGAETAGDLVVLCRPCHRLYHEGGKL